MQNRLFSRFRPKDGDWEKRLAALVAVAGFIWGTWESVFKEYIRPAITPTNNMNLSVNATVLKSPGHAHPGPRIVLLAVSAKNNISKSLLIRKSFWVAHALDLHNGVGDPLIPRYSESEIIDDINDQMSPGRERLGLEGNASSRYQRARQEWDVIGFGPLFDSSEIRPQEEIKVQRIILVPPRSFDLLRVRVIIPSFFRSSGLADDALIQVVGGIRSPSKNFVQVGFCQAERQWITHGIRWFFDKFAMHRDGVYSQGFLQPGSRYCPNFMSLEQMQRVQAEVFTSTYEIPLAVSPEAGS